MLSCMKCKECHNDLTIETAMANLQMHLMYEISHFPDDAPEGEVCSMKRVAKSYDLIERTLKENGLLN